MNASPVSTATARCSPIVELRQYTLHPGARETLIELFDREFIEPQETAGMRVIGQFRDLDDPDRFVWLRGFHDMTSRAQALAAFYGGPVWKAHRETANATMIDSDNVLLLRPAWPDGGFALDHAARAPIGADEVSHELVTAQIGSLAVPVDAAFLRWFSQDATPALRETGAPPIAAFATEYGANTFPALPVREGEHVFVWFAQFRDHSAYARHVAALARSARWQTTIASEFARRLIRPAETLRLTPTTRSLLRGR